MCCARSDTKAGRRARCGSGVLICALALAGAVACASPPSNLDDACEIYREEGGWYDDSVDATERWGVPESVQLAIIHQESRFRARARPPRKRWLGFIPGPRLSSAYGYGQVIDETWDAYKRSRGRRWASRSDFGDVVDFIGWYAARIRKRTGIAPDDTYRLYLAYHEGPGGYARGTHREKPVLDRVAKKVYLRAKRYGAQIEGCREELESPWWWPF